MGRWLSSLWWTTLSQQTHGYLASITHLSRLLYASGSRACET